MSETEITESTGNVFADLGLSHPQERERAAEVLRGATDPRDLRRRIFEALVAARAEALEEAARAVETRATEKPVTATMRLTAGAFAAAIRALKRAG